MDKAKLKKLVERAATDNPVHQEIIPPVVPGRVLAVDGDYLAYFFVGTEESDVGELKAAMLSKIAAMRDMAGAEKVVMHLTARGSNKGERFLIAQVQPYQKNREGRKKPKNWEFMRSVLENYQGALFTQKFWMDREADDGIAYHAWSRPHGSVVIAMRDKDSRMFPGIHLNWLTYQITDLKPDVYWLTGEDGLDYGFKWFLLQLLQGDAADHIPGLPHHMGKLIGEKTAAKLLADCTTIAEGCSTIMTLYAQTYGTWWPDRLAEQAMLLWMRRDNKADMGDWLAYWQSTPKELKGLELATNRLRAKVQEQYAEIARLESLGGPSDDSEPTEE